MGWQSHESEHQAQRKKEGSVGRFVGEERRVGCSRGRRMMDSQKANSILETLIVKCP